MVHSFSSYSANPEYSLFVGDLSASTTEAHLLAFFQKNFLNSIKTVRVMTDPISGNLDVLDLLDLLKN